jgi:vacuolar protein sorting-associated protein 45
VEKAEQCVVRKLKQTHIKQNTMTDQLDGIASVRTYIDRLASGDGRCHGMKVLLLDAATTQIIACVATQSEILSREVYLVSRIDEPPKNINTNNGSGGGGNNNSLALEDTSSQTGHMKAVCFLRPTEANVGLLVKELIVPRFSEYHIYFSGIINSTLLNLLAENDPHEKVRQVQEFYADFLPINPDLLSLNCRNTLPMTQTLNTMSQTQTQNNNNNSMTKALYERNLAGLQSMLLALKRQPAAIRYQASSKTARKLAIDIGECISSDQIFHFHRGSGRGGGGGGAMIGSPPPQPGGSSLGNNNNNTLLLLILDRMDDPVTPLLSQWTYQAMVHELLGLNNSRVILRGVVPNVTKDLEEVVLSSAPGQDTFFTKHRNSNFGELGEAIQNLLRDYQAKSSYDKSNLKSIEDMQQFMEKYPELRSQSHVVSKHVAIMGELARLVEVCSLMDVSAFEQDLACVDDQAGHLKELMSKLDSQTVKIPDKLRLGMLYALRYEKPSAGGGQGSVPSAIPAVKEAMKRGGVPQDGVALVDAILKYAGSDVRGPGLYGSNQDITSKLMKSFMTSVQGVSNVYSQHSPVLLDTVEGASKGKLSGQTHPLILSGGGSSTNVEGMTVPQEILIFMVGGVTYEESTKVNLFNTANVGKVRVILGGSTVHNSTSFLEELKLLMMNGR